MLFACSCLKTVVQAVNLSHFSQEYLRHHLQIIFRKLGLGRFAFAAPLNSKHWKTTFSIVTLICTMHWKTAASSTIEGDHGAVRLDVEYHWHGGVSVSDEVIQPLPASLFHDKVTLILNT